jgi:hypothetical protein
MSVTLAAKAVTQAKAAVAAFSRRLRKECEGRRSEYTRTPTNPSGQHERSGFRPIFLGKWRLFPRV